MGKLANRDSDMIELGLEGDKKKPSSSRNYIGSGKLVIPSGKTLTPDELAPKVSKSFGASTSLIHGILRTVLRTYYCQVRLLDEWEDLVDDPKR